MAEQTAVLAATSAEIDRGEQSNVLTVEHILYLGLLLIAFALRFINLGAAPLSPLEAAHAWPAWLAASGSTVAGSPSPTSSLFYGLQSWLFFVTGSSDLLARLLPALAGTAIVLVPWWWRGWLGRGAALSVALLFAVDPWLIILARTADAVSLTLFLGLLTLTALWHWTSAPSGKRMSWERILAVILALLLVSGPQTWSWLPVLVLFIWLCLHNQARRLVAGTPATYAAGLSWPQRSSWLWFGAALLLGASGLLARPESVAAIGAGLTVWLAQWRETASATGNLNGSWPLVRLLVDQPLLVVFGPLGLVLLATGRAAPQARHLAIFLILWLTWGLLLLTLPGRSPFVLPMLSLPLAIAAGAAIAYLAALPLRDVGGVEVAVLLSVASILVVAGAIWLAMVVENATYDTRLILTAAMLLGLTLLIWLVFGFWAGWSAAGKLAGLFFAGLLLLVNVRSSWLLSQAGGQMHPAGFFERTTLAEAKLLPSDVQRISSMRHGDPFEAPLQVVTAGQPPDPLLGWLLRDMRHLDWVAAPSSSLNSIEAPQTVAAQTPLIIAPAGMEQDQGLAGLIGAKYALTMRWDPSLLPSLPTADADANGLPAEELNRLRDEQAWSQATRPQLEWLLYRRVSTAPTVDSVTLWATP